MMEVKLSPGGLTPQPLPMTSMLLHTTPHDAMPCHTIPHHITADPVNHCQDH